MVEKFDVRYFALAAALLLAPNAGLAQSKVAIINLQRAVLETAEIKKASTEMESRFKPRQAQIEKLQKDLQGIQDQLQKLGDKLTPQAQQDMTVQGQRKQREMQRLEEDLRADVDRERNEILGKSTTRMQEIVKKLAEEKAVDVVIDVSTTVYFKPALEVTTEAIAAYDKAYPAK